MPPTLRSVKSKSLPAEALPSKATLAELNHLRAAFREIIGNYTTAIEGEIARLASLVTAETAAKKIPTDRVHDLRDMLMFIRGLEIKPAKGRRRDFKRIENVIEELQRIVERW